MRNRKFPGDRAKFNLLRGLRPMAGAGTGVALKFLGEEICVRGIRAEPRGFECRAESLDYSVFSGRINCIVGLGFLGDWRVIDDRIVYLR